jgi:bacterioferritin (cytochrome b1)
MQKLAEKNRGRVIDLLNERLAFERAGVKLYDTILARMQSSGDARIQDMFRTLQHNRDEEKAHEEWLEEQIRALGGDDHAPSEKSILVKAESEGIEHVIMRDPDLGHDLHALLTAELADNAGWDLLVQIASEFGDRDAKKEFKKRLHEEEEHLLFVRKAVEQFAKQELTGEPQKMPASP